MGTVTVSTKEEFENAVERKAERIIVTGDLAEKIISAQKKKDAGKKIAGTGIATAAVAAVAGIVLAPVTGGASVAAAAAAATIGATTITMTTAEFIAAIAGIVAVTGIAASALNTVAKNYDVKVNAGNTTVECTRK